MVAYNRDIPDAPNNPSNDQPKMKENFNNIDTLLAVDHVSFNATNGGFHKQIDFALKATPAAPLDPVSVAFTQSSASLTQVQGSATTNAQEFYRNALGIYPLSAIRAFGSFVGLAGAGNIVPSNSFNVNGTITQVGGGSLTSVTWTVNLNANTTTTDNATVLIFPSALTFRSPSYSLVSNVLTINMTVPSLTSALGKIINFVVLQT